MVRLAGFVAVPSWFVVLADCDSARPLAPALRDQATHQISHPSGRPWLLGCWADGTVTTGQAGQTKIALIGQHAVTADQLAEAAGRIGTVADLDRLAASLVGSSHLVASVAGRVRVQGTVTGVRRVFHAEIGDTTVAADRADLLAGLLDTGLDEQRLALPLLEPHILYPLAGEPVWQGVAVLPTDHYLVLDRNGRQSSARWWAPPEPVVPMAEGALALREALSAAVAARVRARNLLRRAWKAFFQEWDVLLCPAAPTVAVYSSVLGGIVTDPALMVLPLDDHMVHRGHAVFVLHGEKLRGGFALQRTRPGAKPQWLLIKRRDDEARPGSDIVAERPESVISGRTLAELLR